MISDLQLDRLLKFLKSRHPLFRLFSSFKTNFAIFTKNVKNVIPVHGAGLRTQDLRSLLS